MNKAIKNYLEQILRDYPQTNSYIKHRTTQLLYPFHKHPSGFFKTGQITNEDGGGTAMLAIDIATDQRLHQLEINQAAIEYCLERSDELTVTIINELYFKAHPILSLEGLALKCNANKGTISRRRSQFFNMLAEQLGII